jgi:hypothetical protein
LKAAAERNKVRLLESRRAAEKMTGFLKIAVTAAISGSYPGLVFLEFAVEIVMYCLFLAVGFAGGLLAANMLFARRLERQSAAQPAEPQQVSVSVNVSEELVARYLATFNLVAVPRDALQGLDSTPITRH